jgi:plastocyanin
MSVTLSSITTAVDPFNDIPDITFDSVDVAAFTEEVEIYTNTPAVMIPTKLNAMAASMKDWLNANISTPLENQQNTFKNEVVVRTNTAMNAVETYMNDEVQGFVNTTFVPWANDAGNVLSNHANILETNLTNSLSQLTTDYTGHVAYQDAIIAQALADMLANLSQYTSGAADSGYSIHQTNVLLADVTMTREIGFTDYLYNAEGNITFAEEGTNITHHINYSPSTGAIMSFGESMQIVGEPRPFVQHLKLENEEATGSTSVAKIKAYDINQNVSVGGVNTFRASGHEINGDPAVELTILNNTSIPDTDNPEIILRRGVDAAMMFGGIDSGDFVKITDLAGTTVYNEGVTGNFAEHYDTVLFKPYQSYCHDSTSAVTGWGVMASHNASDIDGSGGTYDDPTKCEEYFDSIVSLLDDFSRSYEYNISGESYVGSLSDGLIYKVFINDDSGFIDSYAYTVDANGKQGTGAIFNAVYDDGVSDVTITSGGSKYSVNTKARAFDLGTVDLTGSSETKATATHTLKNGMVKSVTVESPGSGYTGYWEVDVADVPGGDGHTHKVHLTQTEVNLIKSGTSVISTTVDAGHTHDQEIIWNEFNQSFQFIATSGAHVHPREVTTHTVNPTITLAFTTSTGGLAAGYVTLKENDELDYVTITDGGADYVVGDTVAISGGTPAVVGATSMTLVDGGIAGFSVANQGTGYTDTTAKTVSVDIQNNAFVPSIISANVGDTIEFTNLDIGAHTVTHAGGMFDSGDIPQSAVFTYVITKECEITDKYDLYDDNDTNIKATLWVRDSSVYVDMNSDTGGGVYGKATVNASGQVLNVAVERPGQGYTGADTVRIFDISGPGEGAYASVTTNRSIAEVTVSNRGTGYSPETQIIAIDPTGMPTYDITGTTVTGHQYGSGAILRPILTTEAVAGSCSDSQYTDQSTCESNSGTWTAEITIGEMTGVTVVAGGSNYVDIEFVINDPMDTGSGATITEDLNNVVTDVIMTSRGTNYDEPMVIVSDSGGLLGTDNNSVGTGFVGSVVLNNGIGSATIVEDWQDYVSGETRVMVIDEHAEPTGYGAEGIATLGIAGNIATIEITNPGTAYKTPVVIVAGPVLLPGASINNVNTDLALFGPEGNDNASPFSYNNSAGTNYKNGIMIQFENPNGHTLADSWSFKLQSWTKGTPESLLYTSSRYDGNLENMRGIITLKDVWEV